jgi:nitronate monooxygenase
VSDLAGLFRVPVVLAPLGGGPSTPALVAGVSSVGALGFLAAAYRTAAEVRDELEEVRRLTAGPIGVNLFVPGRPAEDPAGLDRYLARLRDEGHEVAEPTWEDDDWEAKVELLLDVLPEVVTFTFGLPSAEVVAELVARGAAVGITVTTPEEARLAAAVGPTFLCVQGSEAGAHRGTFANRGWPDDRPLPQLLADCGSATRLPMVAAGGVASSADVARLLAAGAVAVQCGTAFLRCPEAGTRAVHREALADPRYTETVVTRAFSGRPARGLRNRFADRHADAPAAYPEINNATRLLRAAGDPEATNLWAGTGWRSAQARPAAEVVELLTPS